MRDVAVGDTTGACATTLPCVRSFRISVQSKKTRVVLYARVSQNREPYLDRFFTNLL